MALLNSRPILIAGLIGNPETIRILGCLKFALTRKPFIHKYKSESCTNHLFRERVTVVYLGPGPYLCAAGADVMLNR